LFGVVALNLRVALNPWKRIRELDHFYAAEIPFWQTDSGDEER
jgi:hypothetical protein